MNSQRDPCVEALQSALHAACENERRWMEMSPEFSSDSELMEQWTSTAKLRRLEVERIEALLANLTEPTIMPRKRTESPAKLPDRYFVKEIADENTPSLTGHETAV